MPEGVKHTIRDMLFRESMAWISGYHKMPNRVEMDRGTFNIFCYEEGVKEFQWSDGATGVKVFGMEVKINPYLKPYQFHFRYEPEKAIYRPPQFILCAAPPGSSAAQLVLERLYIAECDVSVGDLVEAPFGYASRPAYMQVLKVGPTRESVGSTYTGAVKVISRLVSSYEKGLATQIEKLEKQLELAHRRLQNYRNAQRTDATKARKMSACGCGHDDCPTCTGKEY